MTESRPEFSTIRLTVVKDMAAFARLEPDWNSLFERAYNASPPLHYQWAATWLEVFGPRYVASSEGLRIICCRRNGELVGVLPMYMRRPQHAADGGTYLAFISTGEKIEDEICPDYMDLLCLDEVKQQCAELVLKMICEEMPATYDRVELIDMPDHSPMANWARDHGAHYDLEISPRGVCPISDLEGGMDAYLARLSHKTRAQCRRLLRSAEEAGVTFEVATTIEQGEEFFRDLVDIHQRRWQTVGELGCFNSVPFAQFHRKICSLWLPSGRAILSRIRLNGSTLAVKYGFRHRGKFDFYQSGVSIADNQVVKSPGTASLLLLMQYLIEQGVTSFDFLRGSAQYKQRLATGAQPLVRVRRVLWTWRTAVGFAASLGSRAVHKAVRVASRAKPAAQPEPQES